MRRREFIALMGGVAAAWPLIARAQQGNKLPVVAVLVPGTQQVWDAWIAAFVQRLAELGWSEGHNTVAINVRWAEGDSDQFAEIAAEFVCLNVDVIVTASTEAVRAAKRATSTIPIVFATAGDPVGAGLVASLARPGGNVTGVSNQFTDLGGKRLRTLARGRSTSSSIGNFGRLWQSQCNARHERGCRVLARRRYGGRQIGNPTSRGYCAILCGT